MNVFWAIMASSAFALSPVEQPIEKRCIKVVNVRDHSVEGSANETVAIQHALNLPGICGVYFPPGIYRITDTLIIPTTLRLIYSDANEPRRARLIQKVQDRSVFRISSASSGITISNLFFDGYGGAVQASSNSAIFIAEPTANSRTIRNIQIDNNHFQGFRNHPILIYHASDVVIKNNMFYRNAGAVSFAGVYNGLIEDNQIKESSLSEGVFKVGIRLESRDCTVSGVPGYDCDVSKNIVISSNVVEDLWNSQCILIHSGENVVVKKNVLRNCTLGVSANAYLSTDTIRNLEVSDNSYIGPRIAIGTAEAAGSAGIALGGGYVDPRTNAQIDFWVENAKVLRNQIRWANQTVSPNIGSWSTGGMLFIYTKNTVVQGNQIWWSGANAIGVQYKNVDLQIVGNDLIASTVVQGERNGFRQTGSTEMFLLTGRFSRNHVQSVNFGLRFIDSMSANGFIVSDDNKFLEVATPIYPPR